MQSDYVLVRTDLELSDAQRAVLKLLSDADEGLRSLPAVGASLRAIVSPPLGVAATAALSGMQCPYGDPPEAIVGDFDGNRNMYLHCLHSTKHCWTTGGQSITCP